MRDGGPLGLRATPSYQLRESGRHVTARGRRVRAGLMISHVPGASVLSETLTPLYTELRGHQIGTEAVIRWHFLVEAI